MSETKAHPKPVTYDSLFYRRDAHADECGWHFEEYPWECNCGAHERLARPAPPEGGE